MTISPGGRPADASPLGSGKRKLADYVREVAHALMRKGFSKGHAIATARNSMVKWGAKSKDPAVRAAAAAAYIETKRLDHN